MSDTLTPPCSASQVEGLLRQALQPYALEVIDETAAHAGHAGTGGHASGTHFRVRIGAGALEGCPRVAAHRLVYDALREPIGAGLHALAIEILPRPAP